MQGIQVAPMGLEDRLLVWISTNSPLLRSGNTTLCLHAPVAFWHAGCSGLNMWTAPVCQIPEKIFGL